MKERIFASFPIGHVLTIRPGESITLASGPAQRTFWPWQLMGSHSAPGVLQLDDLLIGVEHVPLSEKAKETGVQTPIPLEKFGALEAELKKRIIQQGLIVTAIISNQSSQFGSAILGFWGVMETEE